MTTVNGNQPPSIFTNTLQVLPELSQESLEIAQREQLKAEAGNAGLASLNKEVKSAQRAELQVPSADTETGDFYETITLALSKMAGLMGDMADTIQVELQFKQYEIKQLLKDKLKTIEENQERLEEQVEARKAFENQKRRSGVFGSVMNFTFAAAEIVSGALLVVGGVVSGNPALIAGGTCLIAAGSLEIAAEVVKLTGGSAELEGKLRDAALGLMIAGIVMGTCGAGTGLAGGAAAAKAGAKEGAERALREGVEEGAERAAREGAEASAERGAKEGAKATTSKSTKYVKSSTGTFVASATVQNAGNAGMKIYDAKIQRDYDRREAELEFDIQRLQARLEAVIAKQEFVNQLIQLLKEQWCRAIVSPVESAIKVLNGAIQDRGAANTRIAASFSV
ncbi:type III secretion system translocon subunit SctE [Microbulbifer sp. JMSA003]|uniref:type III secretion system translocon subunit SctE n=1 Tax=unclassified Microbulbifer TaxID=2619833 RepID=UPI0040396E19